MWVSVIDNNKIPQWLKESLGLELRARLYGWLIQKCMDSHLQSVPSLISLRGCWIYRNGNQEKGRDNTSLGDLGTFRLC